MCYNASVQASFYASGFLYNLKTHQILLFQPEQKNDLPTFWSLLGGESIQGEEAQAAFQRIINKLLKINLRVKDIYPVYDYFSNVRNKLHYVFYAEVGNTKSFNNFKKGSFSWFTFSETFKLPFTTQTKQDIVVGERVINAKWREDHSSIE